MKIFAELYARLDETTRTGDKVRALADYFKRAEPGDAAWALFFLIGRKPRQAVNSRKLRTWAAQEAGIPNWLFQESYDAVGDLAETISLLLPPPVTTIDQPLAQWIENELLKLRAMDDSAQRETVIRIWRSLEHEERFLWNKLISGGFRVGVSQQLVTRALAECSGVGAPIIAHRLMGNWTPTADFFEHLVRSDAADADASRPYPFFLAHALDQPLKALGEPGRWQVEWKWDGIRGQLIRRHGRTFLWTRGEELVTEQYPELALAGDLLPEGTVLDGEILPWNEGQVLPFAQLQRRIGRKKVTRTILREIPVVFRAYDLLERDRVDCRDRPLEERRSLLENLLAGVGSDRLQCSETVAAGNWDELARARTLSRQIGAEGLMLKRRDSVYGVGRKRGDWWKWKVDPYTIDAVLTAARRGSGKRASIYTDYTFSVWHEGTLVTIAQAYSGLTDQEIRQVDAFVRRNMVEKFGPVRTVKPELVFELAFEGISRSSRHKAGVAVRFPRILRWRTDKTADQADTLATVQKLLDPP